MKLIRENKGLTFAISVLAIIFLVSIFYLFWLNWIFSADEDPPNDKNYIALFEKTTGTNFPESGEFINKSFYSQVLSDGWQSAAIKVKDTSEFKALKSEIKSKPLLIKKIRKRGAYFNGDLKKPFVSSDTTYYNFRIGLKLEFIDTNHLVIFEQSW